MKLNTALSQIILSPCLAMMILSTASFRAFGQDGSAAAPKVDFSYAFATPHRITIGRPDASDRTLLDLQPGSLRMKWTMKIWPCRTIRRWPTNRRPEDTCLSGPSATALRGVFQITPQIDGNAFGKSSWTRLDAIPAGTG